MLFHYDGTCLRCALAPAVGASSGAHGFTPRMLVVLAFGHGAHEGHAR